MSVISRQSYYNWKEVMPGDELCWRRLKLRAIVEDEDHRPERCWDGELYFVLSSGKFFQSRCFRDEERDKEPLVLKWLPDAPAGWVDVFEDEFAASVHVDTHSLVDDHKKPIASWDSRLWILDHVEYEFSREE